MANSPRGSLVLAPGFRSEPVVIAGQYLRAAFPAMGSDTLDGEATKLLMHLSHQPYERHRQSGAA